MRVRFGGLEKILVLGALVRPKDGETVLEKRSMERDRDEFVLRPSWVLGQCSSDESVDDFILMDIFVGFVAPFQESCGCRRFPTSQEIVTERKKGKITMSYYRLKTFLSPLPNKFKYHKNSKEHPKNHEIN